MRTIERWAVGFIAVIAAFAIPAWLCGALALRDVLKDSGVRWGVATAAGLAVAAFVALWAYGFVTSGSEDEPPEHGGSARAGNVKNSIKTKGSLFLGPVLQGEEITYNADPPKQSDQ
jgi:hypothetical protein